MLAQTNWVPGDEKRLYERMVKWVNLKSESFVDFYLANVANALQNVNVLPVSASSTLFVISASATAEVAGSNDGTKGVRIRLVGSNSAAQLYFYILPLNATQTTIPQSSGTFGKIGYQVPSTGALAIDVVSDDHVVSNPARIRLTLGLRLV